MQAKSTFACLRCREQKPTSEFPKTAIRRLRTCLACRTLTEKACADCGIVRAIDAFRWNTDNRRKPRRDSLCDQCRNRRAREWQAKHSRTKVLNQNLLKSFGLTLEQFNAMLVEQGGMCAICGGPPENTNKRNWRLHVDHCHACGTNRQLLCSKCNNGLGCFRDNPKLLAKAIEYLSKHHCESSNTQTDYEG